LSFASAATSQQIRFADRANPPAYCLNLVRITKLTRQRRHGLGICLRHWSNF
jgi:hypothetical protein